MPRKTDAISNEQYRFEGFDGPNTTPVPDLFFDELLTKLKEAELRALLYIIRRTYGFKRQKDYISFNQFLRGITTKDGRMLDHGCGITHRTTLIKALRSLEAMGIITSEKRKDEKGEHLTTVYKLRFKREQQDDDHTGYHAAIASKPENGVVRQTHHQGSASNAPPVVRQTHPQETVKQETGINLSNTRRISPKKKKEGVRQSNSQPGHPAIIELTTAQPAALEQPPELATKSRKAPSPMQLSRTAQPRALTRVYLNETREKSKKSTAQRPQQAGDLELIGSLLPNQHLQKPRPTATEAWQVLVDLLADISREFRDEAQLTESVSRAYHLMQHAKITDIGVFTAKIYEARAITKSRYATIKRRMPYFFSVLSDACGLKPRNTAQPPASGQES